MLEKPKKCYIAQQDYHGLVLATLIQIRRCANA